MEEAQQQPAAAAQEHHEPAGISRGKTIALWAGVAALLLALLGSLMIVLKSLQADRALAQIGKSAGNTVAQIAPPGRAAPEPGALPDAQAGPAAREAAEQQGGPPPAAAPAVPKRAQQPDAGRRSPPKSARAVPPNTAQRSAPKAANKQALAAKPVREKPAPKTTRFSVERGLARCKELAGEAAAACFRKACSTYAKRAPICVNDEPTARL